MNPLRALSARAWWASLRSLLPDRMPDRFPTPQAALDALYEGNRRFVRGEASAPRHDPNQLRALAEGQTPFAAFLGCADSRVPVETIFDQGFGDLFVTRVAGNVVAPTIIGSLEFGTEILGAQVLFVLGHTKCGAVSAAVSGETVPGLIATLYQHIRRAVRESGGLLDRAVIRNIQIQAEVLRDASTVIAQRIESGQLLLAGGVYDLHTGLVTPVELY